MHTALTIAGSDSGGGAGIQADLKTFEAFGVFGTSAITAITAQNTVGVTAIHPVPIDVVTAQLEAVASDLPPEAVKTGMLATSAIVEAVAAVIAALDLPNLVVDPVMVAKSGDRLLADDAVRALVLTLLPKARVVTPNVPEAEVLTGLHIENLRDLEEAARHLFTLGPRFVVMKGGHLGGDRVVDVVYDGRAMERFDGPRIQGRNTHGTGCTFASAVAANLALGRSVSDAVRRAKDYVAGAMIHGPSLGRGHRPLNHHWQSTGGSEGGRKLG
ncbi:MAG: bifunctional hydroxymethylpyrimidine kinase/phosphomethylpyrimidine kinase [Vicinamibacterales bacterium]